MKYLFIFLAFISLNIVLAVHIVNKLETRSESFLFIFPGLLIVEIAIFDKIYYGGSKKNRR